jgi:hypothetical protein
MYQDNINPIEKLERSSLIIATNVCMRGLSKRCVAATTTWRVVQSKERAPDFDSASNRSNALFFSSDCLSLSSSSVVGLLASSDLDDIFVQLFPILMMVGRSALDLSISAKFLSNCTGIFV